MPFTSTDRPSLMGVGRPRLALPRRSMIAVGALSALLLSGCSGSGGTSTEGPASGGTTTQQDSARSSSPGGGSPAFENSPGAAQPAPGGKAGPVDAAKPGAPVQPSTRVGPKLTKSASLDLQVKEVAAAAARVRGIAAGLQAQVLNEQIGGGRPGDPTPLQDGNQKDGNQGGNGQEGSNPEGSSQPPTTVGDFGGFGTLTLSVPADKLDTALDQLAKIGTVLQRNTSSEDVTAQYVDTESRLKTMRASVDRVRALMAQAKDLGQVVALESEMSRRQADLEALESQLTALKTSVDRSTLTVSLSTTANEPVTDNGFLAGLRSGWDAFTASAEGLFTAIGALLPFAVFLALIAAPLVLWWRRRQTSSPAQVSN